ncbi:MAG: ATP-binding protein, partial [Limisphaerales bacterium]
PDDYISQIVADGHGWLWFGSDLGIFKIRQRNLEQAMEDNNVRLRPILYGKNEGLTSLEALFSTAPPHVLPRAIHTQDGRVWLLTHTGIVVADPKLSPDDYSAPPVLLTRVAMDGQTVASDGGVAPTQTIANLKVLNVPLRLPPSYRHLEFDYTAFHFGAPENIRFRYQLVGLDDGWIDAETARHADYSRLTAGNYQFQVEACIGDGPWSEAPATLTFTVTPFFWQTWWFRIGALLLFTSSVIASVRYISFRRMRRRLRAVEQQAAIERERGRIARDIHDDLGNRLTKSQLLTGLAQRDRATSDKVSVHVRQISSSARQATDALDEIVWAINPRNDTLPHLINYLGQFAVEFLRTAGIRCRVDLPDHPLVKSVPSEVRHNLFLVIKESLNNIVCHAQATEASLIILVTDESISVIIEDNGCGFNGEVKNSEADGLDNMRQRMAEIGGQFQIKSSPGTGTWVSFNGPWLAQK